MKYFRTTSKRGLALFLGLVMCIGVLPSAAFAAGTEQELICGLETHTHTTVEDFMTAVDAMGDADDLEPTLAVLNEIEAAYAGLSDEDKAAVAETWAYVQEYAENTRAGNPDEGVAPLLGPYEDTYLTITASCIAANCSHTPSAQITVPASWGEGKNTAQTTHSCSITGSSSTSYTVSYTVKCTKGSHINETVSASRSFTCTNYHWNNSSKSKSLQITFKNTYSNNTQDGSLTFCSSSHTWKRENANAWGTAPTCTADGTATYKCDCGVTTTKTVAGSALGHNYGEWTVTTPATCEATGVETRVCANDASHTETQTIAALGHDWGEWADNGENHKRVCKRDDSHVNTADHTYPDEWTLVTAATTTAKGQEKKVCTACGHTIYQDIPQLEATTYTVSWMDGYSETPIKTEEIVGTDVDSDLYPDDPNRDGYTFIRLMDPTVADKTVTIVAVWEEQQLQVIKTNNGFYEDQNSKNIVHVDYTVTVTNTNRGDLYGLRLTDVLTATEDANVTYTFSDFKVDGKAIEYTSTGMTNVLQLLERNTAFKSDTSVTLTYTVNIQNTGAEAVTVQLNNIATAASWSAASTSHMALRKMFVASNADSDAPGVSGSHSSGTGGTVSDAKAGDAVVIDYEDGTQGGFYIDIIRRFPPP